jgi:hypothetical protein
MGQGSGAQRRFGRDRTFLAEDDWFVARRDRSQELAVLANDPNYLNGGEVPQGDLTIETAPAHGTVAVAGRNVLYTPQAGFTGTDTFQYRLSYNDETEVATATVIVRNR